MNDPFFAGPAARHGGCAVQCDEAGVIREVLVHDEPPGAWALPGRSILDSVDGDSREKMGNFLAAARSGQPVVGWEMNVPDVGGLRPLVFAAVGSGSMLVVAAATNAIRLADLLGRLQGSRPASGAQGIDQLDRAARMTRAWAEEQGGLLEELTRLGNESANLQRELARSGKALERQREWLWNILGSLQDAVVATGPEGTVSFVNRAAVMLTRRDLDDGGPLALGEFLRLAGGHAPEAAALTLDPVWSEGRTIQAEARLLREPPHESVPVSVVARPLLDQRGERTGALVLLRDTTETLRVRQLVLESERLGVAARMAAGIAHTVNNALFIISSNAEALSAHLPPGRTRLLENIRSGVAKAAALTERLLAFTGHVEEDGSPVDANEVVRSAAARQAPLAPGEQLVLDLAPSPVVVRGSTEKLADVVGAILDNAREAIHGHGRILVATERAPCRAGGGDRVVVRITDDGEGMSREVRERLFTPFATTKFLGRGLGLAIARAVLSTLSGSMDIRSSPGAGTTVIITLPAEAAGSHPRGGVAQGTIRSDRDDSVAASQP